MLRQMLRRRGFAAAATHSFTAIAYSVKQNAPLATVLVPASPGHNCAKEAPCEAGSLSSYRQAIVPSPWSSYSKPRACPSSSKATANAKCTHRRHAGCAIQYGHATRTDQSTQHNPPRPCHPRTALQDRRGRQSHLYQPTISTLQPPLESRFVLACTT